MTWKEYAEFLPKSRLQICPKRDMFLRKQTIRHRWYLSLDLNIGVSPEFGGLDFSGQIYKPDSAGFMMAP